jgi:asparagine synthase (glutamine-hydrolysing)
MDGSGLRVQCYWDFDLTDRPFMNTADYCRELRHHLEEAVAAHLVSDVPLGAFLSGGIDSSTVVALMSQRLGEPVKTFSIGFPDAEYSEIRYARAVARRFATDHHELVVGPDAVARLPEVLDRIDEPFGDSSAIPTYLVSQLAREHVTVVLTGDGGDELFGGYPWTHRYQAHRYMSVVPRPVLRAAARTARAALPGFPAAFREKAANFILDSARAPEEGYLRRLMLTDSTLRSHLYAADFAAVLARDGWDSAEAARRWLRKAPGRDFRNRMLYADTHFYCAEDDLTKVDRASMAWSLEARVPLLDHRLVEFVAAIPADLKLRRLTSKYVLRQAVADLLPREVLTKRKQGFTLPLAAWLRGPLRDTLHDALLDGRARQRGWLQPEAVRQVLEDHLSRRRDRAHLLWALLALEVWARNYLDRVAEPAGMI